MMSKNQALSEVAIETAWLAYQIPLLAFIRSKVSTSEDAEDILTAVFEKLITSTHNKPLPDNISAWLYHVTRNKIIDYYRTKRKLEPLADELTLEEEQSNTIQQLSLCMLPMIKALPEIYQQALLLSEIEEKTHKEVAKTLGLTLSAVKSRILRGREILHKSMVSCCTLHRNKSENVVDYDPKTTGLCGGNKQSCDTSLEKN